jgi:hypothetical protein
MYRVIKQHACRISVDLDLYSLIGQSEMAKVDIEFKIDVGYWVSKKELEDYNIYAIVI